MHQMSYVQTALGVLVVAAAVALTLYRWIHEARHHREQECPSTPTCPHYVIETLPDPGGPSDRVVGPALADLYAQIERFGVPLSHVLVPDHLWPRIKQETGSIAPRGHNPRAVGNVWGADVFTFPAKTNLVIAFPNEERRAQQRARV